MLPDFAEGDYCGYDEDAETPVSSTFILYYRTACTIVQMMLIGLAAGRDLRGRV